MSKFRSDCWPPVPQSLEDIVELQDPWGKTIHGGTLFLGTKVILRVVDQDLVIWSVPHFLAGSGYAS